MHSTWCAYCPHPDYVLGLQACIVRDLKRRNKAYAQWICNGRGIALYQHLQIRWHNRALHWLLANQGRMQTMEEAEEQNPDKNYRRSAQTCG
jgi:hypothetical protein